MPNRSIRDGVFQRSDRKGWWVSYVDASGTRKKQKVEAYTRTQALNALSGLKARVQTERVLGIRYVSEIALADLLRRFKKYQRPRVSATTFERLESILTTLSALLPLQLKALSRSKVAEYIAERSTTVAPGTVQKEVSVLKHALRLAVEWELIRTNPADKVKVPRLPEGRTRYLSPTELKAVLDTAPQWMRAPIALAAFTGMRRGEILKLRWRDVDLAGRRVYLHGTKNGALRVLALNDLAITVFASLSGGEPSDLLLPGLNGPHLTVSTRRLFSKLNIQDASFHSLRHTAASWLVMQGADLYAVGQFLGHKTPRMTQRYAHLSAAYMAETAAKLEFAFRSGDAVGTSRATTQAKPVQIEPT